MVRGKIELKKIENVNRRQVSFTNRRKVLMFKRVKGKELEGMSFSDLISLESQLNDSLLSVKDQKTILLNQVERSRLQEKRTLEENQLLRKQIESMVGRGSSGPQVEPESSSSDENDKEDHHSGTSLQLGWGKKQAEDLTPR
ncbi:hypothetical protein Bca52824_080972 [Brassica carinata]|uniref:Uncharacterized protein n=1 Tax=Brassica carinata TaxID=52824 RepID=A0A8X7TSR8_BRACI|nr:hypothetical protein Bca52824_080972 [Brassica carinata]